MADYLNPEDSPFDTLSDIARYYRAVSASLLPEHSSHTVAVAVCLPSFEPEWALRLHGTKRRGYSVTVTESDSPIWGADESVKQSISKSTLDISDELTTLLKDSLAKALLTVANTNPDTAGLDGVAYHFILQHEGHGRRCGRTWSPEPSTVAGRLVDSFERLRQFVCSENPNEPALGEVADSLRVVNGYSKNPFNNKVFSTAKKETERLVELVQMGAIADGELGLLVSRSWRRLGLPAPKEVNALLDCIPTELRDQLLSPEE